MPVYRAAFILVCAAALAQSALAQNFDLINPNSKFNGFTQKQNQPSSITAFEAQTPTINITGAEKPIDIGELVVLNTTVDTKTSNLHSISYAWTILPKRDLLVWPDGTRAIFGTGTAPANYTVILTTSFVYTVKDNDKIIDVVQRSSTQSVIVSVGRPDEPVTPINPNPTEPTTPAEPNPPIPTNPSVPLEGLAKSVAEWTNLVIRTETNQEEDIKLDAQKLAAAFKSIATQIDSGKFTDVAEIISAAKTANDAAIQHRDEWLPWFAKLSEYIQRSYNNGTLKEVSQFSEAWKAISSGLDYIGS